MRTVQRWRRGPSVDWGTESSRKRPGTTHTDHADPVPSPIQYHRRSSTVQRRNATIRGPRHFLRSGPLKLITKNSRTVGAPYHQWGAAATPSLRHWYRSSTATSHEVCSSNTRCRDRKRKSAASDVNSACSTKVYRRAYTPPRHMLIHAVICAR